MPMAFALSSEEIETYRENGYLLKERLFTRDEVTNFRLSCDSVESRVKEAIKTERAREYHLDQNVFLDVDGYTVQLEHKKNLDRLRVVEPVDNLDQRFDRLVDDVRLAAPARQLVGASNIALWTAKLNFKSHGVGSGFGWHQDSPYWMHDSAHVDLLPNVMVNFDDSMVENGCLRVIRGSHKRGILPGTVDGSQLGGFYTNPSLIDKGEEVAVEAIAGSALFFDPHLIHGSGPNSSANPRRAIIMTYQPAGFEMLKRACVRNISV